MFRIYKELNIQWLETNSKFQNGQKNLTNITKQDVWIANQINRINTMDEKMLKHN